ncbi:response regulator [Enterobacter asburiae]|jgi:CheY-like chemotaxis protein|uniref:response regulator n=1 Tax=Enterobacter asburiae TaxID=61645 RepID=UPI002C20C007|nr:response regulator [Enterobacter asburiae]
MSNRTFKLLIVEDEADIAENISRIFNDVFDNIEITLATCRDEAYEILDDKRIFFDYITLDLNFPIIKNGFEKDPQNGLAVLAKCVKNLKGTPILILTGTSTVEMIGQFLSSSVHKDVWGSGVSGPTIEHCRKEHFETLSGIVDNLKRKFDNIFDVELDIEFDSTKLPVEHDRLIRIFSKKQGSVITKIKAIGGGLSASKVYGLELSNNHGTVFLRVVSKCGPSDKVNEDESNYRAFISRLSPGATPRLIDLIEHGAASNGAVFYGFAHSYEHSFFSASSAGVMNERLFNNTRSILDVWYEAREMKTCSIKSIRQKVLSDDHAYELMKFYNLDSAMNFEDHNVSCSFSIQHGDLHGENILINITDNSSSLIDYGDIGEMVSLLDPITLECSFLFHPAATKYDWPTDQNLENWSSIEQYLYGCPIPSEIRFCRDWLNSRKRGNREVSACLYSYALRQLKYPETNKGRALKLIEAAYRLYSES